MRLLITPLLSLALLSVTGCDSATAEAADAEESVVQLYLSVNIQSGKQLLLSDNSLYEVAPGDVKTASTWLTPFPIRIDQSGDANYPCKLTNMTTNASIKARAIAPVQ